MAKRVAIFGGSFNPPTIGHAAICDWLLKRNPIDEVWVVPCLVHPFGKGLAPFSDRYEMCLFAFKKFGPMARVSKIEETLGGVSHTVRTIHRILEIHPEHNFSLVTGEDVNLQAKDWLDFDKIKGLVPIIKVPRGQGSPIPDVSATEVRRRIAAGESFVDLVPREVAVYIVTHKLYR